MNEYFPALLGITGLCFLIATFAFNGDERTTKQIGVVLCGLISLILISLS